MDESPHKPVSKKALAAWLGEFTMTWNDIHFSLFFILWRLMSKDSMRSEAIFFALRSDRAQRDLTTRTAKAVLGPWPDLCKRLIAAIERIGKLNGRRNDFIHAMWIADHPGVTEVWQPSSPRLSKKEIKTEAKSLYGDCISAHLVLVKIGQEIENVLYPDQPPNRLLSAAMLASPPPQELPLTSPQEDDPPQSPEDDQQAHE